MCLAQVHPHNILQLHVTVHCAHYCNNWPASTLLMCEEGSHGTGVQWQRLIRTIKPGRGPWMECKQNDTVMVFTLLKYSTTRCATENYVPFDDTLCKVGQSGSSGM